MATIKSFTDLEQSKKLAEILPLESADMYYSKYDTVHANMLYGSCDNEYFDIHEYIPCWSLASLLSVLPEGARLLKSTNISSVGDTKYHCDCPKGTIDEWFDYPVDACAEMILKLKENELI